MGKGKVYICNKCDNEWLHLTGKGLHNRLNVENNSNNIGHEERTVKQCPKCDSKDISIKPDIHILWD